VRSASGITATTLILVYYSCAILFFGVELTRADRATHQLKVEPKETAVALPEHMVVSPRPGATTAKAVAGMDRLNLLQ
jgi:hypothetical protein